MKNMVFPSRKQQPFLAIPMAYILKPGKKERNLDFSELVNRVKGKF